MVRRGGPNHQPSTTGYINTEELHLVRRLSPTARGEPPQWEMACGRVGVVRDLKDRTAAEVAAIGEICQGCVTAAWCEQLVAEAQR